MRLSGRKLNRLTVGRTPRHWTSADAVVGMTSPESAVDAMLFING